VDRSQANKTLTITTGSNQQFANFVCATSGTNTLTINSSTTTAATFTKTGGGTVVLDYVNVTYITGSPASTWAYGTHGSGDTWSNANGWTAEFITALLGVQPGALISGQIIITPATSTQFTIAWEAKSGATYLVRAKRFRNPISPTSGYFVYQGTVNTCSSIRESNTRYVVYWLDPNGTWILWACKNIYRDGAY
jgi:hypothetical protein